MTQCIIVKIKIELIAIIVYVHYMKKKNESQLEKSIVDVEYCNAINVYLAFLIDRIAMRNTRHNTWHLQQDTIEKVFGRQAISMVLKTS